MPFTSRCAELSRQAVCDEFWKGVLRSRLLRDVKKSLTSYSLVSGSYISFRKGGRKYGEQGFSSAIVSLLKRPSSCDWKQIGVALRIPRVGL